jgi:hypothetical protein
LNGNPLAILVAMLCASLTLVARPAAGQSFYGSLVAVVRDGQGGVIPGATIVLTNTGTGERREGARGENGEYSVHEPRARHVSAPKTDQLRCCEDTTRPHPASLG